MEEAKALNNIDTLSKLVGKTVRFKVNMWNCERQLYRKYYVAKTIVSIEFELEPTPHILFKFSDGTERIVVGWEDSLDEMYCDCDGFGNVKEYLSRSGFLF